MVDEAMRNKLDTLVQQEVVQGYRIVEVPAAVQKSIQDALEINPDITPISKIRFSKLTPKKRAQVDEAVLQQYHADLQKAHILSRKKIKEHNVERGEWSQTQEDRIEELQAAVSTLMEQLSLDGLDKSQEWKTELSEAADTYIKALEASDKHPDEKEHLKNVFWRWANYTEDDKNAYNMIYAPLQNRTEYSQDSDLDHLYNTAPGMAASESLSLIEDVQFKLGRYVKLFKNRMELMELLGQRAKMYEQSVETRRDNAEEMARLYYGIVLLDENDKPIGPIAPSLEAFWDYPPELISWLVEEAYFFYNAIPKAIRNHLDEWGFTTAGRETGLLQLLGESQEVQNSRIDTSVSEETPLDSSESVPQAS